MAFSGGTFSLLSSSGDYDTGQTADGAALYLDLAGIATGLSSALLKDGSQTVTANITLSGYKLTNVGDATASTDALNRQTGDARYPLIVSSTTDNTLPRFNSTAGQMQTSGVTINDSDQASGVHSLPTTQTGTTYTLAGPNLTVLMNNGSANTVTASAVTLGAGGMAIVVQKGAGATTLVTSSGTLNAPNGAQISQQHGIAFVVSDGTDMWVGGDVTS
jgi:hypothetical protein